LLHATDSPDSPAASHSLPNPRPFPVPNRFPVTVYYSIAEGIRFSLQELNLGLLELFGPSNTTNILHHNQTSLESELEDVMPSDFDQVPFV